MFRRRRGISLGLAIWLIVGIVLAFIRDYITLDLIAGIVSALLAIILWPLLLIGIDLRVG